MKQFQKAEGSFCGKTHKGWITNCYTAEAEFNAKASRLLYELA